jgi:hypothetical protein
MDVVAFLGGGESEAPSVYLAANGQAQKIATPEIDMILADYTEAQLAGVFMDTRTERGQMLLQIRLPNKTLVYDGAASALAGKPVWFILSTSIDGDGAWDAFDCVWCYGRYNTGRVGSGVIGYLTGDVGTHWGATVGWEIVTPIVYNESRGAIMHDLELVGLPGHAALGADPVVSLEYSSDGVTWSQPKYISAGAPGARGKRMLWLQQSRMANWRAYRFRGTSDARLSVARLEARVEALAF